MLVRIGCRFEYEAPARTPSLWQVRPHPDGEHGVVAETWEPPAPAQYYVDAYGNACDRLTLPAGHSVLRYDATVAVPEHADAVDVHAQETAIESLPSDVRLPAPEPLLLARRAARRGLGIVRRRRAGWSRVQAVSDWVHENIRYEVGASTAVTTAYDVWESRTGVCRDLTQLGITLCRALNIPARYVAGYLPDIGVVPPDLPMDFCSWFEAWLDGRWWTFDPRNNEPRIGRVVIARGRDALDGAMVTTWGAAELEVMEVWADEVI